MMRRHGAYDAEYVHRFLRILVSTAKVMERFRGRFIGKCSPVQFFWGSCDLACTRFSGRPAPARRGVISGPAYSHEVCSAGFWPGGGAVDGPAYYAYAVPMPAGLAEAKIRPARPDGVRRSPNSCLMYDDVRRPRIHRKNLCTSFWRALTTRAHAWANGTGPHSRFRRALVDTRGSETSGPGCTYRTATVTERVLKDGTGRIHALAPTPSEPPISLRRGGERSRDGRADRREGGLSRALPPLRRHSAKTFPPGAPASPALREGA